MRLLSSGKGWEGASRHDPRTRWSSGIISQKFFRLLSFKIQCIVCFYSVFLALDFLHGTNNLNFGFFRLRWLSLYKYCLKSVCTPLQYFETGDSCRLSFNNHFRKSKIATALSAENGFYVKKWTRVENLLF